MKFELLPANGDPPIPIRRNITVVGRREFCDEVIPHPSLSKRHCVLIRTEGLLIIRDLVSTNGTKVNGQKVSWAALMPNDRLTLGRVKFKVYGGPEDMASPSERPPSSRPVVAPTVDEFDDDDAFLPVAQAVDDSHDLPDGLEILDDEIIDLD